jgi:peptidyl-prolyl cis-trans isomerase D
MREGMRPVMWAVAVAFIASLFFVGATALRKIIRGEGQGPMVVEINGKKIGANLFEPVFYREVRLRYLQRQRETQRPMTEQEERELRMMAAGAALNQIVQKELILAEAKRMGLRVADEEIRYLVESDPAFQIEGRFDNGVYERFLAEQKGMTPGEYETWLRDAVLINRVFGMVAEGARLSPEEVKAQYERDSEQVRVAYAYLPAAPDLQTEPTKEALKSYYSAHLERYHLGRRVRLRYVLFDLEALREKIDVSDAQVKEYYEQNKTIYFDAGEIRCRHLLFAVPPGESDAAWEAARRKAEAAAARARAGEDFAALAEELSEDPNSAARGGDLGFFGRGRLDPDFEAAAFALPEGEISDPVRTMYGYHVLKREPDIPPFGEQAEEIREVLLETAAEDQAMTLAMELAERVGDGGDLAAEAAAAALEVGEPAPFEADGEVGDLGLQRRLAEEAFTLDVGEVGSALPVAKFGPEGGRGGVELRGYLVYQVTARLEPGPAPFSEVAEAVKRDWRRDTALENVADAAAEFARAAEAGGDLEATAKDSGWAYGETLAFTRHRPAPELGGDYGVAAAAFDAAADETVGPLRGQAGYYVVRVLEKTPADPALFATRGDEYRSRLLQARRQQLLAEWYRDLVSRARIKNNLSLYLGAQAPAPGEREDDFDLPFGALGY